MHASLLCYQLVLHAELAYVVNSHWLFNCVFATVDLDRSPQLLHLSAVPVELEDRRELLYGVFRKRTKGKAINHKDQWGVQ